MREAEALKLCFKSGSWYLYAFCRKRQDYRFFKLSRMRELTVSEESFERMAPVVIFSKNEWSGENVTLKLRLSPAAAFRVYDEFETAQRQPDGSFVAEITMPRQDWIYSYIFSFGEHCEVLEPEDIRDTVKTMLEKTLKSYL